MKRKLIISSIIGASLFASFTIGAYAASKTSLFINGQKSNIAVKVIEGVSYVPLKDISKVFDASVTYNSSNNSLNFNSSNISNSITSTPTQATASLKDAKSIEKYLNETYGVKSPLKTSLTDLKFSFSVTENKSKFEAYDLLINFHYDVRSVDQLIFDNQNSN
ncbi:copper amine oxidase N-terminal domain-containing protein [Paenibacillus pabuli]|uniref:copper amine oxidase N-terminal domain-containing protein n=1 Tax=Paenibacillus pabuli TaxID=1472 RepID=UPI001FFEC4FD|nr:copper amine oxidase N-terminal domain-containing protein [Paenibacillus pabuli]UPK45947.1 hypothetical protein KET34_11060 [Paenibacillus pabuli]